MLRTLVVMVLLCLGASLLSAQDGNPIAPNAKRLEESGRISGTITRRISAGRGERFGEKIWPLDDIDGDGLNDFAVVHTYSDTVFELRRRTPVEVLLFRGKPGRYPRREEGERIGPSEFMSVSSLLCAGDWDDDGHTDIAFTYYLFDDPTFGAPESTVSYLIILWNDGSGHYSIGDSSRLYCTRFSGWGGIQDAASRDIDGDGIEDLVLFNKYRNGHYDGQWTESPTVTMFRGHRHARWGRDGVPNTEDWRWWRPPLMDEWQVYHDLDIIDQDHDGAVDIVLHGNQPNATSNVVSLYGRPGSLPDTVGYENFVFTTPLNVEWTIYNDITGDGVPELLMNRRDKLLIGAYAGWPGQRLLDQLGNGNDGPQGGERWWRRPWAETWMPRMINSSWDYPADELVRIGDMNGDGIHDLLCLMYYPRYLTIYSCGQYLDSLADAVVRIPNVLSASYLGDVDGSGRPSIAMYQDDYSNLEDPGRVLFVKGGPDIPAQSWYRRIVPFAAQTSVPESASDDTGRPIIAPNPAFDFVYVSMPPDQYIVGVNIVNPLGQVLLRRTDFDDEFRIALDLRSLPLGWLSLRIETTGGTWFYPIVHR